MCFRDPVENLAGHLACPEREPWNEGYSISLTVIDHIIPFTVSETVTVLHRDDGNNLACSLNVFPRDV
jgi:hypothetical protein